MRPQAVGLGRIQCQKAGSLAPDCGSPSSTKERRGKGDTRLLRVTKWSLARPVSPGRLCGPVHDASILVRQSAAQLRVWGPAIPSGVTAGPGRRGWGTEVERE